MKYYWVIAITLFLFIFAIALAFNPTDILWPESNPVHLSQALHNYRYHFIMISRATEADYWEQAYEGALKVALAEKVALEYYGPRFLDLKELERLFEMAVLSNVDGILISLPNEPTFKTLIMEAVNKKIPVVALGNNIDQTEGVSFVGVDSYDLGFKTGQTLTQAVSGNVQFAVLVNSNFSSNNHNRYLLGIRKAIQNYPELQLKLILTSKGSTISAEEQTQSILYNYPEIEAIICSDSSDTLGVAKVVVDLNQVNHVTIIGSGLTDEIANYIKRGVIWGVLADDPIVLGAQGLSTLIRIKEEKATLETYKMPLFVVNQRNINEKLKTSGK